MKVVFEQKSETYPDHVISGVKESIDQAEKINYLHIKE